MKIQTICAISIIFLLGLNVSVAHADEEVKCVPRLDVDIDDKNGYMAYRIAMTIHNPTNHIVTETTYSLMSADGNAIGGEYERSYLYPNESMSFSEKKLDAGYSIEWSEDPEIRKRQEIEFENVRQEKENNLKGAYCELVGFTTKGWTCTPQ
jgi:hypothetical protein